MRIPFFNRQRSAWGEIRGPDSSPPAGDPAGEAMIEPAGNKEADGTAGRNGTAAVAELAPDDPLALFDAEDPSEPAPPPARVRRHDHDPPDARARRTGRDARSYARRAPVGRPDLPLQADLPEGGVPEADLPERYLPDGGVPEADLPERYLPDGGVLASADNFRARALEAADAPVVPDRLRSPAPLSIAPVFDRPLASRPVDAAVDSLALKAPPERAAPSSAGPTVVAVPVPPHAPPRHPLSLEALLMRRTPIEWPEAVAVVDAVCARLVRPDGSERTAPDLAGIHLHADGTVEVGDGVPGEPSAVRLARTLHALAGAQAIPPPLRLLITKWTGSAGTHTILEFAADLSYFARPDGPALVRAVYERFATGPPASPAPEAGPLDFEEAGAYETAPHADVHPLERPLQPAWRLSWVVPAVLSIAAAGAAAGVWLLTLVSSAGIGEPTNAAASPNSPVVASAGVTTSDPLLDLTGGLTGAQPPEGGIEPQVGTPIETPDTGGLVPGGPAPGTPDTTAAAATNRPTFPAGARPTSPSPARTPGRPSSGVGAPLAPSSAAAPPPATPVQTVRIPPAADSASLAPPPTAVTRPPSDQGSPAASRVPPPSGIPEDTSPTGASPPPSAIYTQADIDVQPPTLVYPQLPPPPTTGPDTAINTLEVVVDQKGGVEEVRLISIPVRLTDMTLLSNAKNWRFDPAQRDGKPVRYRMRVSWATTP